MVGGSDPAGADSTPLLGEESVAQAPGGDLAALARAAPRLDLHPSGRQRHAETAREPPGGGGPCRPSSVQGVVEMRGRQLDAERRAELRQRGEQGRRVRAAGEGDQDRVAGVCRCGLGEESAEPGENGHGGAPGGGGLKLVAVKGLEPLTQRI